MVQEEKKYEQLHQLDKENHPLGDGHSENVQEMGHQVQGSKSSADLAKESSL